MLGDGEGCARKCKNDPIGRNPQQIHAIVSARTKLRRRKEVSYVAFD